MGDSTPTRRDFLKTMAGAAASLTLGGCSGLLRQRPSERPPNFVVIFADDMGYRDLGCFGAPAIRTPNIDRMAAEGIKFTDFYAAASVCSPSRAALLTGCYPPRVGVTRVLFPVDKIGLNPEEATIARLLKSRGYATACIGKWHLGEPPAFHPKNFGFDYFFGLPFSNTTSGKLYPKEPRLMRGDEVIETTVERSTLTQRCTAEALRFIAENKRRPFFLYLPHPMPHIQLGASPGFLGKSRMGLYGDVIEELDWGVGQILRALRKHGLAENTLVVFTSDNGPWLGVGRNGGSALPLRNGKFTTWEGGMREPCVMWWPGRIPAGAVCREVASTIDLLPTLATLAGAPLPTDRVIDGRYIWPLMAGAPGAKSPHEGFFYYTSGPKPVLQAVRSGRWKLRTGALYDLENDVAETQDVAAQHPAVAQRLFEMMKSFDESLRRTSRPVGRIPAP